MHAHEPRLWIDGNAKEQHSGHFRFDGACGPDVVLVELDREAAPHLAAADALYADVQMAARRMWSEGRAYKSFPDGPDGKVCWRIAITAADLTEAAHD